MTFQLANTASALERAVDAITEAGRKLEYCQMQVRLARSASNESLPEEDKLLNVIDALQRIEHIIRKRYETVTHQLKVVQMQFMIETEQEKATQDINSDSGNSPVRPLRDLSSLPRFIDHDGDTVRGTSLDGMSYAGTVVRGDVGPASTSKSYQATSEQLPFQ